MNRAERRKQSRKIEQAEKVYTFTQAQIDNMKEEATKEATRRAFVLMLGFPLLALRDVENFGKKRLTRFTDKVFDIYDAFNEDRLTMEDMHKVIEEETGVTITEKHVQNHAHGGKNNER